MHADDLLSYCFRFQRMQAWRRSRSEAIDCYVEKAPESEKIQIQNNHRDRSE